MAEFFKMLVSNRVLDAAVFAWFIAQVAKVIIEFIRFRKLKLHRFFGSGGMPSSHSACVSAMAFMVCKIYGFSSVEFGIAALVSFIVIFDAVNVRRAAGSHAEILNSMMQNADRQTPELYGRELKESLGHTPFQAVMGILLGITISFIISLFM